MIDKTAGLPTQIRQLEKRLKEMDASKVKPALVKEITDTIKNLKDMLKEKQEKRELRKKEKAEKTQEVEAANPAAPGQIGAVAPNAVTTTQPGQPEATPTTPDDKKVSCPLCGGMTFNDQAAYQQHMEFTHASDVMPTTPGQKLDKTVAAIEPTPIPSTPEAAPAPAAEPQGPQFKLDDTVMPIRGSESKGKVMRWDGKPNDLVYVMWESGPLKDRDGFGGYYPHDLKADVPPAAPVEAAMPEPEPVCEKCVAMQQKHGDLKTNYEALLKDLQEERDIHYTQGNHSWVARLDQKIEDLKKAINEKFGDMEKTAGGGPREIREIHRAIDGHGYEATTYDLVTLKMYPKQTIKINDTKLRMTDPTHTQFEVRYDGMDWKMVTPQEYEQWKTEFQRRLDEGQNKQGAAENAHELTVMDHTPPRANSGPDAGGKDTHDEFQDEWAMPVTSATKLNVFKRELLATPAEKGYDISLEGKKLFNIVGRENKPMNKKQLEFCAQIEFTRGMKQAKLTEKIASLEAGSTVFVMAEDKTTKRVKFASLEHGFRGWAPMSKFAFLVKEGQMMQHKDHIDNTFGNNGKQVLVDCPNGSGNMVWVGMGELLPINPPPATPESLNDLESSQKCKECGTGHMPLTRGICAPCRKEKKASIDFPLAYFARPEAKQRADQFGLIDVEDHDLTPAGLAAKKQEMLEGHDIDAAKECPDCHGTFEGAEGETCPTCGRFAVQKTALKPALPPAILNQRTEVNADLKKEATIVHREDGWHVMSEKGKHLGGPYKSKPQAVKRLRQVEYFKHHSSLRPFGKSVIAEALANPYQSLTEHITDMRGRMSDVQERLQTVPPVKTAEADGTKMDLPALFEDITHGIALVEDQLGGDENSDPAIHKMVEELENKLWKLEEECGITPKLSPEEKAEPEHKEIVKDIEKEAAHPDPDEPEEESEESDLMDNFVQLKNGQFALVQSHNEGGMIEVDLLGKTEGGYKYVTENPIPVPVSAVKRILEWDEIQALKIQHEPWPAVETPVKQADQVTDETVVTNDPNAVIDPAAVVPPPTIKNVQPTDDDNLEIPTQAPTSPLPAGQKWQWDSTVGKYVAMTDPAAIGKTI